MLPSLDKLEDVDVLLLLFELGDSGAEVTFDSPKTRRDDCLFSPESSSDELDASLSEDKMISEIMFSTYESLIKSCSRSILKYKYEPGENDFSKLCQAHTLTTPNFLFALFPDFFVFVFSSP